jgi:YggT family protein
MGIVCILLTVYWLILLVRILSSWFAVPPSGPFRTVMDFVYAVTEPVLRPIRGIVPPVRMGAIGFDLSPIIVFVVIGVLQTSLGCGGIL